jgi:hypothetical protein
MAKRRRGKPVDLPLYGDVGFNINVYDIIGALVINWANDECWFQAMLKSLLGGDGNSAAIAWYSHNSTASRIDFVMRLCRQHIADPALLAEITAARSEFAGCTKIRNFFCHATYSYDAGGKLASADNVNLSDEGNPIRVETRFLDRQTLNQIIETTKRLADLNETLSGLPAKIEAALKGPPSTPPP